MNCPYAQRAAKPDCGGDTPTRQIPSTRPGAGVQAKHLVPCAPCGTGRERRSRWGGVGHDPMTRTTAPDNPVPPRKGFLPTFCPTKSRVLLFLCLTEPRSPTRAFGDDSIIGPNTSHCSRPTGQRHDRAGTKRRSTKNKGRTASPVRPDLSSITVRSCRSSQYHDSSE